MATSGCPDACAHSQATPYLPALSFTTKLVPVCTVCHAPEPSWEASHGIDPTAVTNTVVPPAPELGPLHDVKKARAATTATATHERVRLIGPPSSGDTNAVTPPKVR
jgi:hypothetical protein